LFPGIQVGVLRACYRVPYCRVSVIILEIEFFPHRSPGPKRWWGRERFKRWWGREKFKRWWGREKFY
jgi:hypothetical protein